MNKIIFLVISNPVPDKKPETIIGIIKEAENGLNALRPIIVYDIIFGRYPETESKINFLKSYFILP